MIANCQENFTYSKFMVLVNSLKSMRIDWKMFEPLVLNCGSIWIWIAHVLG